MRTRIGLMVVVAGFIGGCTAVPLRGEGVSVSEAVILSLAHSGEPLRTDSLLTAMATDVVYVEAPKDTKLSLSKIDMEFTDNSVLLLRAFPEYIAVGLLKGSLASADVEAVAGDLVYWSHDGKVAIQIRHLFSTPDDLGVNVRSTCRERRRDAFFRHKPEHGRHMGRYARCDYHLRWRRGDP